MRLRLDIRRIIDHGRVNGQRVSRYLGVLICAELFERVARSLAKSPPALGDITDIMWKVAETYRTHTTSNLLRSFDGLTLIQKSVAATGANASWLQSTSGRRWPRSEKRVQIPNWT
mmetsp:Transcript_102789/g.290430  ORF Transcript_102789/g.290430 Transcript_102789/m.290430 type:complete len:116 (-) Transcript_102789:17-364(-)